MINGLTTGHRGLEDLPECGDQESYYMFPWSLLITVLSSLCCGVKPKRELEMEGVLILLKSTGGSISCLLPHCLFLFC